MQISKDLQTDKLKIAANFLNKVGGAQKISPTGNGHK